MECWYIGILFTALAHSALSSIILNGFEISKDRVTGNGWDIQPNKISGPLGFTWVPNRLQPAPPALTEELNKYVWCPVCFFTQKYGRPMGAYSGPAWEPPLKTVNGFDIYKNRIIGHGWDIGEKFVHGPNDYFWEESPQTPIPPKLPPIFNKLYEKPTWNNNQSPFYQEPMNNEKMSMRPMRSLEEESHLELEDKIEKNSYEDGKSFPELHQDESKLTSPYNENHQSRNGLPHHEAIPMQSYGLNANKLRHPSQGGLLDASRMPYSEKRGFGLQQRHKDFPQGPYNVQQMKAPQGSPSLTSLPPDMLQQPQPSPHVPLPLAHPMNLQGPQFSPRMVPPFHVPFSPFPPPHPMNPQGSPFLRPMVPPFFGPPFGLFYPPHHLPFAPLPPPYPINPQGLPFLPPMVPPFGHHLPLPLEMFQALPKRESPIVGVVSSLPDGVSNEILTQAASKILESPTVHKLENDIDMVKHDIKPIIYEILNSIKNMLDMFTQKFSSDTTIPRPTPLDYQNAEREMVAESNNMNSQPENTKEANTNPKVHDSKAPVDQQSQYIEDNSITTSRPDTETENILHPESLAPNNILKPESNVSESITNGNSQIANTIDAPVEDNAAIINENNLVDSVTPEDQTREKELPVNADPKIDENTIADEKLSSSQDLKLADQDGHGNASVVGDIIPKENETRASFIENKGLINRTRPKVSIETDQGRQVGILDTDKAVVKAEVFKNEDGVPVKNFYRNNVLIDKFEGGIKVNINKSAPSLSPQTSCDGIQGKFANTIDFNNKFHRVYDDDSTLLSDVTEERVHLKSIDKATGDLYEEKYSLGPQGKLIFQRINGQLVCGMIENKPPNNVQTSRVVNIQ